MNGLPRRPMDGRTVLVTGATGGIGRATAMGLATMRRGLRLLAGTVSEPTTQHVRSVRPAAGGWTCSSRTCRPSPTCGGSLTRYSTRYRGLMSW
jgi:NAD(P)-dependent dehydrogenase (short-subunit alcohol dehydrogenase family)